MLWTWTMCINDQAQVIFNFHPPRSSILKHTQQKIIPNIQYSQIHHAYILIKSFLVKLQSILPIHINKAIHEKKIQDQSSEIKRERTLCCWQLSTRIVGGIQRSWLSGVNLKCGCVNCVEKIKYKGRGEGSSFFLKKIF